MTLINVSVAGVGVRLGWGGAEAETFMAGLPAPSDKRQNFDGFNPLSWAKGLCMNVVAQGITAVRAPKYRRAGHGQEANRKSVRLEHGGKKGNLTLLKIRGKAQE